MPCRRTSRTRSSSRPTCAPRSSAFEIWHPMPCSSSSAITRPPARSVASSEACRGRRWPDSCTPSSPKASGRLSCGGSCPRSGQGRCMFPSAWVYRCCPRKRISSERTLRTRFATPRNSLPRRARSLLTVSASLLVTLSAPRTHERPERVPVPAPAVERPQRHPVVALSAPARTPAHGPSGNEGEPGDRRGPNRGESRDHGHPDDQGKDQNNADHGENPEHNDQGEDQGNNNDQGEDQATTTIRARTRATTTIRARTRATTTIRARTRATTTIRLERARSRSADDRTLPRLRHRVGRTLGTERYMISRANPVLLWARVSRSKLAGAPPHPTYALGPPDGPSP